MNDEELILEAVPDNPYLPPCDDYYFFEGLRQRIRSENMRRRFCHHFKIFTKRHERFIFTTPNPPSIRPIHNLLDDRVRRAKIRTELLTRDHDAIVYSPDQFCEAIKRSKRGASILWIEGDPRE